MKKKSINENKKSKRSKRKIVQDNSKRPDIKKMVIIALLSALAFVLMTYAKLPVKYLGFLEMELSDVPALIASFSYGPISGILVELIKNLLHLPLTSTGGVGELANFLVMSAFVIPAGIFRKKKKPVFTLVLCVAAMIISGIVVNMYITVPFYIKVFGGEKVVFGLVQNTIKFIDSVPKLVFIGITPFNVVKGIVDSVAGYFVYKALRKGKVG